MKGYALLLFVALALVVAMILTAVWGRDSRHGYGAHPQPLPSLTSAFTLHPVSS